MQNRKRSQKSLHVIKACESELKSLEAQKKSQMKSLYVVRTNDEVTNKYRDVIYDYVDQPGVFVVVSRDKTFCQTFRQALIHDLEIENEFVQLASDTNRAAELVQYFHDRKVEPCIFLEHSIASELTLPFLRYIKASFKDIKVAVLSRELNKERLFQFFEDGAESFLKKPASINSIITKIAYMLKPQCEADALVQEGRDHVEAKRFEEALALAEQVLSKWPKHAGAMVVYGDAKKGMQQREEALDAYKNAEKNSRNFLEPLQKIVMIHVEDDNKAEVLKYLTKLDKLSPLNCNRKLKIAELHFDHGDSEAAEKFFDSAINSAKNEALSVVGEMAIDIAEMAAKYDPKMAAKYYRQGLDFVKSSKSGMAMNIYNRLGISLRKQGLWLEAIEAYDEAAKYSPKDENIQYNIALAFAEGDKYLQSAERIDCALNINPQMYHGKCDLACHMAEIYIKANKKKRAAECLLHVQEREPNFPGLSDLMESAGLA